MDLGKAGKGKVQFPLSKDSAVRCDQKYISPKGKIGKKRIKKPIAL